MNWTVTFYAALLFFILTPAVLVRLPPKGGKYTVAAFHALVFALVFHFTAKFVWQVSRGLEGFQEGSVTKETQAQDKAYDNIKTFCNNQNPAMDRQPRNKIDWTKGDNVVNCVARQVPASIGVTKTKSEIINFCNGLTPSMDIKTNYVPADGLKSTNCQPKAAGKSDVQLAALQAGARTS